MLVALKKIVLKYFCSKIMKKKKLQQYLICLSCCYKESQQKSSYYGYQNIIHNMNLLFHFDT